jgi:hypothetical protein
LLLLTDQVVQWFGRQPAPLLDAWLRSMTPAQRALANYGLFFGALAVAVLGLRRLLRALPIRVLRIDGEVILASCGEGSASVERGDWVVYRQPANPAAWLPPERYAVEEVLALPGDHVRYTPLALEVNGRRQRRWTSMPGCGEAVVPGGHWLIWPMFARCAPRLDQMPESAVLRLGWVSHDRYVGRVTRPWLGRRRLAWLHAMADEGASHG